MEVTELIALAFAMNASKTEAELRGPVAPPYQIHPTFPKWEARKNKSQIPVTFLATQKVAAKEPHSPRKPPQIDHQNTTLKHPFLSKTPAKHHNPPPTKKATTLLRSLFFRLA